MNKNFLIILLLLNMHILSVQSQPYKAKTNDPFCRMVETVYHTDVMLFTACHLEKKVFENDTIKSFARVLVQKNGTVVKFLRVTPEEGEKELLFCQDSAWVIDHQIKFMTWIGTTIDAAGYNYMSSFVPMEVYAIDTLISQVEPFWRIIDKNKRYTTTNVAFKVQPKEVSDLKVEFVSGNKDHLIYKILKECMCMNADKMYEELILSDYSFPEADQVRIPEYYATYSRDLDSFLARQQDTVSVSGTEIKEIYLENMELSDLNGTPYQLPSEGLIFMDLWYVGCAPCMKSAPVIEKLFHSYHDRVYFFSVNEVDRDTAKINRFCDKMGITMPMLLGGQGKITNKIPDAGGYPVFILMEAETGKVIWSLAGYAENLEEMAIEAITRNL